MLENLIFMIRAGSFGTDYLTKLFVLLFSLAICWYDWKKNKRKDYLYVFLIGTLIWFLVEFSIQIQGVRVTDAYLFGMSLPIFFAALLRGAAEGGFVILFGLFFADRLKNKKWLSIFILLTLAFFITTIVTQGAITDKEVSSKRDLLNNNGLIYMAVMVLFDIFWLAKSNKEVRKRAFLSFLIMIIVTGAWTIAEFISGTRWIELGTNFAPTYLQFLGLGYDVIVEIGLAYIPFLGLAYLLGLIKNKK